MYHFGGLGPSKNDEFHVLDLKIWRLDFAELFRGTVLEEKLNSRALLQDSEPSRAANAISDVFLVKVEAKTRY